MERTSPRPPPPGSTEPAAADPALLEPGLVEALALTAAYVEELLFEVTRDTHRAVADRVFGLAALLTLRAARIPQAFHDGVAEGVYASVGLGLHGAVATLSRAASYGVGPRLDVHRPGLGLQSVVNGLLGHRVRAERPQLAPGMSVRVAGRVVPPRRADLADAFPDAGERVVVFVHGLAGHEGTWSRRARELGGTYGTRLREAGGWTPVYLRTNSGLSVAENGAALASLLQQVVEEWPCPVRRLCLVGHSMGGLVVRAGCAVPSGAAEPWTDRLTDVVTLGTPHLGADLALAASHGARVAALLPELAAVGRLLEQRSSGIRDLERGLPDVPPLPRVRYRLVSAGLGGPGGTWDRMLGDLLVRRDSATGAGRSVRLFPEADVLHVPHADHNSLLNHPAVAPALVEWLG